LVSGLVPGNEYLIRVVPVNIINTIEFDICVATPCPDPPNNLVVNGITATSANLSHSYPFGISRRHEVREAGGGPTVFSFTNIQATAQVTGLEPNTDYEYYVIETCGGAFNLIGPEPFTTKLAGDECVDALPMTQSAANSCGTNLTQGTVQAATSSQPGCTGTANDDVWYQFEATSTDFTVFLESGNFVVQLFAGNCGSLTSLVCEDRVLVNETFSFANATVGATYYLRVYSFGGTALTGSAAEFGICVFTTAPAPDNDDCVDAVTLVVDPDETCDGTVSGTTNGASRPEADPRCAGINGRATVWYAFTATGPEHLITLSNVDLLNGNASDRASFEVFSGGCGARTRVQCSGQLFGTNPGPQSVSGLTAGQEYLIRVVPVNPFDAIDFDICVTSPCPELTTGLSVSNITATGALLGIDADGEERDFIVVAAGEVPVYGDASNHLFFRSSTANSVMATGLAAGNSYDFYVGQVCPETFAGPVRFDIDLSLPIELLRFTGETLPKTNRLEWVSGTEENTDFHRVERSADGQQWTVLGTLAAAGTSTTERYYEFVDYDPLSRALYRIVTVDLDGTSGMSPLLELVRQPAGGGLRLGSPFPSPTNGAITLEVAPATENTTIDLRIIDAAGRELQRLRPTQVAGWNRLALDLSAHPAGLYWLRATDATGATVTRRVVKR
ncbi:MAG: T9SS type A sorting domain-containing protein, partial [Bacteroidota bacterium]